MRAADGSGIAITTDICKQFALSPDLDGGDWEILPNDTGESGILKTTSFYVRGTGGSWFSSSGFTEQGSDTTGFGTREKPFATIQKAIDAVLDANDESSEYTIYVDGTFTASSADIANFSALSKALTVKIVGLNKSDKAVLDGNNAARVIVAGDDSTAINISLTLENLIIQNGNSTARGAGVTLCAGAGNSHTIKNCEIKGNNADYGAAIYNKYSPLHLEDCTISDNITTTSGTVYNGGSADAILTMSNVSITNNRAGNGGGIFIGGDGSSSQDGASTVRISDLSVIISGNTSTENTGAGICIWQGKLELSGSAKIAGEIYLRNDKQHITITGALSQSNVADIYANDVSAQTVILDGASSLVSNHYNQFTLTNSGWEIGQDGYMRKK